MGGAPIVLTFQKSSIGGGQMRATPISRFSSFRSFGPKIRFCPPGNISGSMGPILTGHIFSESGVFGGPARIRFELVRNRLGRNLCTLFPPWVYFMSFRHNALRAGWSLRSHLLTRVQRFSTVGVQSDPSPCSLRSLCWDYINPIEGAKLSGGSKGSVL